VGTVTDLGKRDYTASRPERVTESLLDILEVLWQAEDGVHGYELARKTKRGRPTVYNNIDRLSKLGWITNDWEDPTPVRGRPLRKIYRFSPEGQKLAEKLLIESGRITRKDFNAVPDGPGSDV
jgi:DNA-binding PadR family transcriptional regulator